MDLASIDLVNIERANTAENAWLFGQSAGLEDGG